jgi:hypothetical protein
MHKIALALAVTLAACFTVTNANAQQADPAYEWNVKNMPPSAAPAPMLAPAPAPMAAPEAAKPAKAAKKSKKKAKKA